ncbi:MAG: flagellar basal body protein [Rhizomicrobium sp.]
MSLSGIMSSALSALQTNTEALRVTSNNIANMNTQGYARRVVNEGTLSAGTLLGGVDIDSVQRIIDTYLNREVTMASGSSHATTPRRTSTASSTGCLAPPATTRR